MWHSVIIVVMTLLSVCYLGLILYYRHLFIRLRPFHPVAATPTTRFSIIIPARNEAENIERCIHSIYLQDYPAELFEVVVIDDHSSDDTSAKVVALQQRYGSLKLVQLADAVQGRLLNAYKKKAIETAIPQTTGEWILTTDADCHVGTEWLRYYDAFIREQRPVFVAAPVKFMNNGSLVSVFQCLDFLSLQGVTAAAVSARKHSMCNGANLAYQKSAFIEVDGFRGIDKVASGDDMLLMHKIRKRFPGKLGYLFAPQAIVRTTPMPDWMSFFNQRIRWASKAESYDDKSIFWVLVVVYIYNVMLTILPVMGIWDLFYLKLVVVLGIFKSLAELSFMIPVAGFYKEKNLLWWFPLMQPLHIVYVVTAGWLGKFGSYHLPAGRQVRNKK
jgi:cellulose synthase/poly-beta-1,6-N-acetylglucosamine synthase-like glycosyltransferase